MIGWIVFAVLLLLVIFLAIKSAQNWHVGKILVVVGIFLVGTAVVLFTAASLRTRQHWMKEADKLTKELEKEQARRQELAEGRLFESESAANSIRGLRAQLVQALYGRGQVWRTLKPQGIDAAKNEITLSTVGWGEQLCRQLGTSAASAAAPVESEPADGGAPAAPPAATRPHGIVENQILHAFAESPLTPAIRQAAFSNNELLQKDEKGVCQLPTLYLGEFRVTSVAESQVTLAPTLPLDAVQLGVIGAGQTTWVLYENMPQDSHYDVFAGFTPEQLAPLFQISAEQLKLDQQVYRQIVDDYARDLQPAKPEDPNTRKWARVRFVKPYQAQVDANVAAPPAAPPAESAGETPPPAAADSADDSGDGSGSEGNGVATDTENTAPAAATTSPAPAAATSPLAETDYDPEGRALDPTLLHGGGAEVPAGAEVLVHPMSAASLIAQGVAEQAEVVFVRPLSDYEQSFHLALQRATELGDQMFVLQEQIKSLEGSKKNLDSQIEYRQQEREQLQADQKNYEQELGRLNEYVAKLTARIQELQTEIRGLLSGNMQVGRL